MNDIKTDPSIKAKLNIHKSNTINNLKQNTFKRKIFFYKKIYKNQLEKDKENSIKFLSKKTLRFKVEKSEEYNKRKIQENDETNEGRWTREEHDKFLDGIVQYGINWKKVKSLINTRSPIQVRSHAQKFYRKLKMCKDEKLGIDFTSDNITSIREMILLIKTTSSNYNIKNVFKYLCDIYSKKTKKMDNYFINSLFEKDDKKNNKNFGENTINFINNNNLNINDNNGFNSINNSTNLLNINQTNNAPLNNNILFNNNINNTNFFDCRNIFNHNFFLIFLHLS